MEGLRITRNVTIPESEVEMTAMRAQGAGGQNVNKLATAIHLRFDIRASSLPEVYKERLLALPDRRISKDGVVVIKSQAARSQEQNRAAALERLRELVQRVTRVEKVRRPTAPTKSSVQRRLQAKGQQARTKALRGKVRNGE